VGSLCDKIGSASLRMPPSLPNSDDRKNEDAGPQPKKNPWVQVGRYSQLAFALPAATVIGWLIGSLFDRWLHATWISVVGLVLGMVAGLADIIRTALRDAK
jgi:F0F1-type ATP synthase assembly protein I